MPEQHHIPEPPCTNSLCQNYCKEWESGCKEYGRFVHDLCKNYTSKNGVQVPTELYKDIYASLIRFDGELCNRMMAQIREI